MPKAVRAELGLKLEQLELGYNFAPPHAKVLTGFEPTVQELIENHAGDTYRAIVTVKLEDAVYVLHTFK
jgi:phage-related protein